MSTALVVDDDPTVGDVVGAYLHRAGFEVHRAADGVTALALAADATPDVVVLDLMLPGIGGLEVCRRLRRDHPRLPVVMLTALGEEEDRILGLEVGADDYVTKPFSVRELLGRVRAQLRRRELDRSDGTADGAEILAGPVAIDLARHLVTVRGEPTNLTRSEFQVLRLLAGSPGEVFSRKQIMEELWQTEFRGDVRACDVHISNLRQKVERDPQNPELVLTVRRVGYRFAEGGG
ncbi:MAG: response regulator [Ornithinibacter sp.]